jgi:hypothetical protein
VLQPQTPPPLWELDRLPREALEVTYTQLADFVAWLEDTGLDMPGCWLAHRHLVHRLAAIMWWRAEAHSETATPKGTVPPRARDAAEWWASSYSITGWLDAASRLPCKGQVLSAWHRERPAPTLDEAVTAHVASLRAPTRS